MFNGGGNGKVTKYLCNTKGAVLVNEQNYYEQNFHEIQQSIKS